MNNPTSPSEHAGSPQRTALPSASPTADGGPAVLSRLDRPGPLVLAISLAGPGRPLSSPPSPSGLSQPSSSAAGSLRWLPPPDDVCPQAPVQPHAAREPGGWRAVWEGGSQWPYKSEEKARECAESH